MSRYHVAGASLPVDENQNVMQGAYSDYVINLSYDASNNLQYVGKAEPAVATNTTGWQIKKLQYDGSSNLTSVVWASGTRDYTYQWDQKATYVYL